jgi:cobalt-zinc-cadmium efflux system protein
MWWLGWTVDPATAVLIGAVVAIEPGCFASFAAAMDAVPRSIDQGDVRRFLAGQPGSSLCTTCISGRWAREIAMTAVRRQRRP